MKAPEAVIKALTAYLKIAIPTLQAVTDDWPNASQSLKFPAITVMTGEPLFVQAENYVIWKSPTPEGPGPNEGKFKVRKVNGSYDMVLKAHLWADSKPKRHDLYENFMAAMNPDFTVAGLRLQMANYFNEWATFDVSKNVFLDNEESAQRAERRVIVDILVNVRSVIETTNYLIEQIENTLETPASIPNITDPSGTTII